MLGKACYLTMNVRVGFSDETNLSPKQIVNPIFHNCPTKWTRRIRRLLRPLFTAWTAQACDLLEDFQRGVGSMKRRQDDLAIAQKLFNLPMSTYPAINSIEAELARVGRIYSVYLSHKV